MCLLNDEKVKQNGDLLLMYGYTEAIEIVSENQAITQITNPEMFEYWSKVAEYINSKG